MSTLTDDLHALGLGWERIHRIAYAVARRDFRFGTADAEDIAQEMLLRVLQRPRGAEINATWVSTGARFLCIDLTRSRKSEARALDALVSWDRLRRPNTTPGGAVNSISSAMAMLPEPCRRLIEQYFWYGMTWAEIDESLRRGRRCSQYETKKCLQCLAARLAVQQAVALHESHA